jgi:hypothetical protein
MVPHMKTTLNISEQVVKQLKQEAVRSGKTMSELVELALRGLLSRPPRRQDLPELPVRDSGGARVTIADREALYDVMVKAE